MNESERMECLGGVPWCPGPSVPDHPLRAWGGKCAACYYSSANRDSNNDE